MFWHFGANESIRFAFETLLADLLRYGFVGDLLQLGSRLETKNSKIYPTGMNLLGIAASPQQGEATASCSFGS